MRDDRQKTCRHCGLLPASRSRGLCHRCFNDLAVRDLYPKQPHRVRAQRPAPPGRPVCRNCNFAAANRPRGLCVVCYYAPGVRDGHPSTSKFARRSPNVDLDVDGPRPLPSDATDAPPGSAEKVAVLEARAARGEALFHPHDAGGWDGADGFTRPVIGLGEGAGPRGPRRPAGSVRCSKRGCERGGGE